MPGTDLYHVKTISELHQLMGLPRPEHPLISLINLEKLKRSSLKRPNNLVFDFYSISLKRHWHGIIKYGQQQYHSQDGIMYFMAPGQVFGRVDTSEEMEAAAPLSGWSLYVHPDFLWNTPLAKVIRRYEYWDYSVHEALFLSDKEESIQIEIMKNIQIEYFANTDKFSQNIIISQIEVLLNYADRFYHRQFLNRKIENHQILHRLEDLLTSYFNSEALLTQGLPSVQSIAEKLNIFRNARGDRPVLALNRRLKDCG